ncbi:DNA gyrase subunit A [uncultured Dietzia sp.]|uniref:DNA gyrase subunit A n=1 Tax=uncultured Dietzia sp. TaxID=395519 RepID=UPI0025D9F658|nr:DNA gyrase subunit A [uncultured Dietzia sp.]
MRAISADGGWFGPGDDLERACDEAEAILLAAEDLDAVMEAIREAESPVDARRALKLGFGFTGRQAALLLTLPVMSFTRSERRRLDDGRRARMELLADVTGALPAIPASGFDPAPAPEPTAPAASYTESPSEDHHSARYAAEPQWDAAPASDWSTDFGAAFDGVLAGISSAMEKPEIEAPPLLSAPPEPAPRAVADIQGPPVVPARAAAAASGADADSAAGSARPARRSMSAREDASAVLNEQIGELCDAIAMMAGVRPPTGAWSDDPRSSSDESGALLDSCGVDDQAGIRTLLWHLRRTGLDSLEGLFPFAEPLSAVQGFDAQSVRFESAMSEGGLGSRPGSDVRWASRLWPIAERRGFGYAVVYGGGSDAGSVWAYGGDEPLHRLWDSVVDLLVELYQSLTTGSPCDAAVGAVVDGRVVWTNLS